MKEIITHLRKAFDHRIRLGVMSMLMVEEWVDFTHLRDNLEVSDGNLASHLKSLDKEGYIDQLPGYRKRPHRFSGTLSVFGKNHQSAKGRVNKIAAHFSPIF